MTGTINCWPFDAVSSAPNYTGEMLRQTTGGVFGGKTAARPLGARSGVWPGTSTSVVSISGTTVTVGSHGGVLDLEASATAGPYVYAVAVAPTLTINAANATNPRIDLISLQLSDPAEGDGTSVPSVVAVYTAGTAASIPAPPAAPARSLTLAQVNVPHSGGGAATITFAAPYAVAAGGILPTSGSSQYPASPQAGQYVDDPTLGLVRFGAGWVPTPGTLLGETVGSNSATTMPTNSVNYEPGSSSTTVVLADAQRVRVVAAALVNQNTTVSGDYRFHPAYNTGGSITTPVTIGNGSRENARVTTGLIAMTAEGTVLLAAGTYTFYPSVLRATGGTGTDNINLGYVAVYAAGPS